MELPTASSTDPLELQHKNVCDTDQQRHDKDAPQDELREHEQRHRRSSSGAESTLAPLATFLPAKVFPRGDSFSMSSQFSSAAGGTTTRSMFSNHTVSYSGPLHDSSSLQMDLQARTANYETILHHFNLRKLHTEQSTAKIPSVMDYSTGHHHHHTSMRATASSGSARHVVSVSAHSPSFRHARFSLYRSLKNLRRNAFDSVISWIWGPRRPMTPTGTTTKLKNFCAFWVYCFQLLYLPFAPMYLAREDTLSSSSHELTMMQIITALEPIYLLDILATFNTARREIARRYLKGYFGRDMLSALSMEAIAWLSCITRGHQIKPLLFPSSALPCWQHPSTSEMVQLHASSSEPWIGQLVGFLEDDAGGPALAQEQFPQPVTIRPDTSAAICC